MYLRILVSCCNCQSSFTIDNSIGHTTIKCPNCGYDDGQSQLLNNFLLSADAISNLLESNTNEQINAYSIVTDYLYEE